MRKQAAAILCGFSILAFGADGPAGAQELTPCGPVPPGFNAIVSDAPTITGTAGRDFICAGDGDNVIRAGRSADIVHAGDGRNVVYGEAGADVLHGGDERDWLYGGGGNDVLVGGAGIDILRGGAGADSLRGESGNDRLFGQAGNDSLRGKGGRDVLDGGEGIDRADGGRSDDLCIDTRFVRWCESTRGIVAVDAGFERADRWRLDSRVPSIGIDLSADGRYAVFTARDEARPINRRHDVVVRDMLTGEFTVVGWSHDARNAGVFGVGISDDGRFVTFGSLASDLVEGDTDDGRWDIFLHDRRDGTTRKIPRPTDPADGDSWWARMSSTGRFVVFHHRIDAPSRQTVDVWSTFVYDVELDALEHVSVDSDGVPISRIANSGGISDDGNVIVFGTEDPDVVDGDANGTFGDGFVRNRMAGTTTMLLPEINALGHSSDALGVSPDGSTALLRTHPTTRIYWPDLVFVDIPSGETTTISADGFCDAPTCAWNTVLMEGDWVAATALGQQEALGRVWDTAIVVLRSDGESEVLADADDYWLSALGAGGAHVGLIDYSGDEPQYVLWARNRSS